MKILFDIFQIKKIKMVENMENSTPSCRARVYFKNNNNFTYLLFCCIFTHLLIKKVTIN